uniref:Uncharacterized protein n=1 Tax=Tanacetum cinerariifolium TaxID=118510 RepID=A0A6L2MLD0_TANCI|nr:hypothetical protein [Tanacetum cinerariifolium]
MKKLQKGKGEVLEVILRIKYYKEYLEKVAKHQRYLAGEEGSDPDSPAPKPAKATKKSKPSAPKATPITKLVVAQQPKPKPAPANTQEKKRKVVAKTSDEPSPAKSSKPGKVTKRCKPTSSLSLVDEFVDEGIPEREPRFDDEEADIEPDSGKFQPLKEKVSDEQVALDLLTLPTPKKVSPAEQYIFQRLTPAPTEPSGHAESPSIYVKLGLTDSDTKSDEEGSSVVRIGAQDEGQAGPNRGVQIKGQENLKLTVVEQVILEEPASSTGTLSSLQHLAKDFSFGDQFFNDKPSEAENEKTTTKTEAESMVSVTIQQDTSAIPPMKTPVIDLTSRPDSPNVHRPLQATTTETTMTTRTTTTHPPPPQPQQSTTYSILIKSISELKQIMANLIQDNKHLKERDLPEADMKEILHQRMWETNSYKAHEDHMMLYEPLEKSINHDHTDDLLTDFAEARRKKKKRHDSRKTPPGSPPHQPPPPPPAAALSSSKTAASAKYTAWTTTNKGLRPSVSSISKDLHMDDDTAPDEQVHSSNDEDIKNAHIPKVNLQQDWWKPLEEGSPATPEPAWSIPSSDLPVLTNNWASALASTYTPSPKNSLLRQTGDTTSFMDRPALLISKMKATYYPDVGLEQMVPDQMWIEEDTNMTLLPLIDSPRAVTFRDKYGVQMVMRFNEIHKFNDGTLQQIHEALDYRVKEFKVNRMTSEPRDHPKISLGHYSIMLASSYTVKSKIDIKSPTHYPRGLPEHPSDTYVVTMKTEILLEPTSNKLLVGILTVAAAGQRDVNSQPHAHTLNSLSKT